MAKDHDDGEGLDARVRRAVADALGSLFDAGRADVTERGDGQSKRRRGDDEGTDIGSQVERAVRKVKAQDEARAQSDATEQRIKQLEERAAAERRPAVEVRRVTRRMWGMDDGD